MIILSTKNRTDYVDSDRISIFQLKPGNPHKTGICFQHNWNIFFSDKMLEEQVFKIHKLKEIAGKQSILPICFQQIKIQIKAPMMQFIIAINQFQKKEILSFVSILLSSFVLFKIWCKKFSVIIAITAYNCTFQ